MGAVDCRGWGGRVLRRDNGNGYGEGRLTMITEK